MMRHLLFVAALTVCAADRIVVIGDATVAKRHAAIAVPASEAQFPPAGSKVRAIGAAVERTWGAIKARTGNDGGLMDVYESTGKQPKLDASFRRTPIWHRNPRGGAMALLPETESLRP